MKITKPEWLKICRPKGAEIALFNQVDALLKSHHLNTVCNEAMCPNRSACWSAGTATFMVLGDTCTRHCSFCAVKTAARGKEVDANEGQKIAGVSEALKLNYVVLTSVDRDDLPDLGAGHFAGCITAIKQRIPGVKVEVLTPDFDARPELIKTVIRAGPDVFAHNIEAVERLEKIRDRRAKYRKSLDVLRMAKHANPKTITKSSILLGVGEKEDEVIQAMEDLRSVGVDAIVMGQYLQPTKRNLPVTEYISPEKFKSYGVKAYELGFRFVVSEPFARTSYKADRIFRST